MPKFHFVKQETTRDQLRKSDRLVVEYSRQDFAALQAQNSEHYRPDFRESVFYLGEELSFTIKTCGNSIILIDPRITGLFDKLHVGQLVHNRSHVESSKLKGENGPRMDLSQVDLHYGTQSLRYLKMIAEDQERRQSEVKGYLQKSKQRYSDKYRLRELSASQQTLEQMLEDQRRVNERLSCFGNENYVSDKVVEIERLEDRLVRLVNRTTIDSFKQLQPASSRKEKIVVAPGIFELQEGISRLTNEVLRYVTDHPHFDLERARDYWKIVDSRAECLNGFNFLKYSQELYAHLQRHFTGSRTPGSTFDPKRFHDPVQVIDLGFDLLRGVYSGRELIHTFELPYVVGEEAVILRRDIPSGTPTKYIVRDGMHLVLVAYGLNRPQTNLLTVHALPLSGEGSVHWIKSIYPGRQMPDIDQYPERLMDFAFIGDSPVYRF